MTNTHDRSAHFYCEIQNFNTNIAYRGLGRSKEKPFSNNEPMPKEFLLKNKKMMRESQGIFLCFTK